MRMNWAVFAVILCYAAAPAATCDPRDQLSPLNEPEWTLADPGSTISRALVAPSSLSQEAMSTADATIVWTRQLAADSRPVEDTIPVASLPSTSTAPDPELQMRLLMACLGFVLAVAGGVMLLLPRR